MRSRALILLIAALAVAANLLLSASLPLALAAGVAVALVGEGSGWLLGRHPKSRTHVHRNLPAPAAARSVSASDTLPLSARECDVARLVAAGLTNRQIAQRLFLGERTIDNHVQHCFNKLGLENRAQLAVWARDHGLVDQEGAAQAQRR